MPNEKEGVSLRTVLGGLLKALAEAKHLANVESARLYEAYKQNASLSRFLVPAFTVSEVDAELRFAVIGPADERGKEAQASDLKINISPDFLKGLEAHHISVVRLKISPLSLRAFEEGK